MTLKPVLAVAVVMAAAMPVVEAGPVNAPLNELLDRATTYVDSFVRQFSTVVAEERYVQDSHPLSDVNELTGATTQAMPRHVELCSDYLFVTSGLSTRWLTFRDVYSVNGRAVRDREARLVGLFMHPAADAIDRASQISREGHRFNIGSPDRTIADPLLALGFLQAKYREHFDYQLSGIDASHGSGVWIVKFKERVRPTLLRTTDNHNVVATGRLWIEGTTGRVLQTELGTNPGDRVMTTFTYDEHLQMDVPSEMRDIAWSNRIPVTGLATYSNFRRFNVLTDEKFR